MRMDWTPFLLTLQLAAVTTVLLLMVGLPLAYWLAFARQRWRIVVESLVSLPLVLPPTVLGFYLLLAFSPRSALGQWLDEAGVALLFSFEGVVIGSMLYSVPFMVQPIQSALQGLPPSLIERCALLDQPRWAVFGRVYLPQIAPAVWSGVILTFAHTVGEFGVVLMIGGNIPGVTKVASIAVYDEVEALNYGLAHRYAAVLFVFSFVVLLAVYGLRKHRTITTF